jgi:hypothetical protein
MDETCKYTDFFHAGQRATVEVAVEGGGVFNDGAVVTAVEECEIALHVCRERLPEGALMKSAESLMVRIGGSGFGYSCKAVLVQDCPGEELRASLVGPVIPEDTREFFRLGTEIPVVLFNVTAGTAEESGFGALRVAAGNTLPRIVNISGGGLRTETKMAMNHGDVVYATFHLPLPEPKVVPVVAQVVHNEVTERDGSEVICAGLTFMHINEGDRDSIVRYVCNEEIKRIRHCRKKLASNAD